MANNLFFNIYLLIKKNNNNNNKFKIKSLAVGQLDFPREPTCQTERSKTRAATALRSKSKKEITQPGTAKLGSIMTATRGKHVHTEIHVLFSFPSPSLPPLRIHFFFFSDQNSLKNTYNRAKSRFLFLSL
jgi:hypothetical protein